jgi:hypothetical protein
MAVVVVVTDVVASDFGEVSAGSVLVTVQCLGLVTVIGIYGLVAVVVVTVDPAVVAICFRCLKSWLVLLFSCVALFSFGISGLRIFCC